jgi:hypothetical protein
MKPSRFPGLRYGTRPLGLVLALALLAALWVPLAQAAPAPGTLDRVSLSSSGVERNKLPTGSTTSCTQLTLGKCAKRVVSDDGNAVAFGSRAPNLVDGDNNNASDIYLWRRDTAGITLTRVSAAAGGGDANGDSETPSISPNGQWVAFESKATNLVGGDTNSSADVFVWSAATGLILASKADNGSQGNLQSFAPSVANNGTVTFTSFANNLVAPGKTSQFQNVFVRKTPGQAGETTDIVSVGPADVPGAGPSKEASIDAAGAKVAFTSAASNIRSTGATEDTATGEDDVFVRDLAARTTVQLTGDLKAFQPAISPDGDQVAYAAELGDSDIRKDIFVTPSGGGGSSLVSNCGTCSDLTDRPATVPSISTDGKVAFQSAARFEGTVRSDQVWVTSGPVAASKDSTDSNLADNVAELASISGNGNFVAYTSAATNLVPGDFNGSEDVFLKDMSTKAVTRISQRADGTEASGFASSPTHPPAISGDGSVVAFSSDSSNLIDNDTNGLTDIFVRAAGSTSRISVGPGGAQSTGGSIRPVMSADGRYVVFESVASNLVAGDNNGMPDIFLHDRSSGETRAITSSVGQSFPAQNPAISPNGRFIAFESRGVFTTILATQMSVYRYDTATGQFSMASSPQPLPGKPAKSAGRPSWDATVADDGSVAFISRDRDLTGTAEVPPNDRSDDIFVQRQAGGPIAKVTVNNAGETADGDSFDPVISADGNRVAFSTLATNMPATGADANPDLDVYLRDIAGGRTLLASVGINGGAPGGPSVTPTLNRDGSLVAYASRAENLVGDDSNVVQDIFLANPFSGAVTRLSTRPGQEPSAGQGNLDSYMPAVSSDGLVVAFMSSANNLVEGDANDAFDTFVRRLTEAPQCGVGCQPGPGGGGPLPGGGGAGYRFVASDGGIFSFGDAKFHGSTGATKLNKPIVGMSGTPSNQGYWLVASDGGIFSFGDAKFMGSTGDVRLNSPIVGMAAHPTGEGYWFVAADGGIFSFGKAKFSGSMGGTPLNKPIVGMAVTPSGGGYWLVASDGGIFSFGDAKFYGSTGDVKLNKPIVGMDRTATGNGYRFVASDGGIFTFGDAKFYGSTGDVRLNKPIVGMAKSRAGDGYWLVASDGGIFSFGDAKFMGSTGDVRLNQPIVGMAS